MLERFDPALRKRILSAAVLVVIAMGDVAHGGWPFAALIGVATAAMAWEWSKLAFAIARGGRGHGSSYHKLTLIAGVVAPWAGIAAAMLDRAALGVVLAIGLGVVLAALAHGRGDERPSAVLFGAAYLSLPGISLVWLRAHADGGMSLVIWLFVVVWTTDTAAYFVGRSLGGPKLAPSISPKKTWSGAIGGVVGATLASMVVVHITGGQLVATLVAVIVSIVGQAGDLLESWLKRIAGAKDSGTLIPGHGGVLDRMDALLLAAPTLAGIVWLLTQDVLT